MYYWELKTLYPGDPEFTFENFPNLPWHYVLDAFGRGMKTYKRKLHEMERPLALQTSVFVNSKLDPKKGKTTQYSDFCFYGSGEDGMSARGQLGAAMLKLHKIRKLPPWALFCFKEVTRKPTGTSLLHRLRISQRMRSSWLLRINHLAP